MGILAVSCAADELLRGLLHVLQERTIIQALKCRLIDLERILRLEITFWRYVVHCCVGRPRLTCLRLLLDDNAIRQATRRIPNNRSLV